MTNEEIIQIKLTLKERFQHARAMLRAWEICEPIILVMPDVSDHLKKSVYEGNLQSLKEFYRQYQFEADQIRWRKRNEQKEE